MSVQRSPPPLKEKENVKERAGVLQHGSEQDLEEDTDEYENVSRRTNKRRAVRTPPQMKTGNAAAANDLREAKRRDEEIKESISFLSEKYDVALKQIESLKSEKNEDKKRIIALEERVDYLEKKTCSATIEIRNVPKLISEQNKYEGKEDLSNFICKMGKIVDAEIKYNDIKDIYRIKPHEKSNGTGTIIAEFSTVLGKERVLTATKKFNKDKQLCDKLHTEHFNLKSEKKPIYVSESITKKTAKLFSQVREFAKANGFTCWIFRGAVFLRFKNNERVQIKSEHDLASIQNKL
ncbi:hypothetical protein PYW08_015919 [Mythimna loreyi]|uniref:Uncharacterized protein n=1 Tax=Mythimna loreyi TaxID=667449 RepID=A0ACC2QS80_9NEOP|nr:hypothetical protein PYW08_015919 [Mythimna loreyi]